MANARALILPPVFAPMRYGLLSAAIDRSSEAPPHWQAGVTWESSCPDSDGTYDPCLTQTRSEIDPTVTADPATPPAKAATSDAVFLRGATAFTVFARLDCSPPGFWDQAQDMGIAALTRTEAHQVERAFDTGVAPKQVGADETVFPHLRSTQPLIDDIGATLQTVVQVVTAAPVDIVEGLGRLESALADCYHGRGVIHVPAILANDLAARSLISRSGAVLETTLGNRVSLGMGYSGASPEGVVDPTVAWVYATGAVFYYRGDVRVNPVVDSFNRSHNTVQIIAERTYVIGWDCCHLAVPIHVGGLVAGGFDVAT